MASDERGCDAGQAPSSQRIIASRYRGVLLDCFANPSGFKRIVEQIRKVKTMKRICMLIAALALGLAPVQALAQDKLVVSVWGGSWRDMVDNLIGKKFTAATGVPVEYITGGTIDRLNKEKLAAPDFDPSHLIVVSALLSGGDASTWEKGQAKLKELKPNFKAFYTNDANSQQLIANGETPVQVILSMNAHYMAGEGVPIQLVIPKEGTVLGIDTVAIMKGSKKAELAYKFINIALDPQVQAEVANFKKGSPVVLDAKLDPAIAKLPGVFTSVDQWNKQAIIIDHKLRAEKTAEWRKWFAENIMN